MTKHKTLAAVLIALVATSAAANNSTPTPSPDPGAEASAVAVGVGLARAGATSSSVSSAQAEQAQTQEAVASADSEQANEQSLELSQTYKQVRQTPSAFSGGTNTTAQCHYSVGAGASAPVAGLSFGFGRKDRDCERLVLAQYLRDIGQQAASERVLCQITELKRALGADFLALVHEVPVVRSARPVPVACPECATRQELDRAFKKSMEKQ